MKQEKSKVLSALITGISRSNPLEGASEIKRNYLKKGGGKEKTGPKNPENRRKTGFWPFSGKNSPV